MGGFSVVVDEDEEAGGKRENLDSFAPTPVNTQHRRSKRCVLRKLKPFFLDVIAANIMFFISIDDDNDDVNLNRIS